MYKINEDGSVTRKEPDSNMVIALITTFLCCPLSLPLGIVSIVYSVRSKARYKSGDYQGAKDAADKVKTIALFNIVCNIIVCFIYNCTGIRNALF